MQDAVDAFFGKKNIAVVGATDRPEKYGYKVFRKLLDHGYHVFPVHPTLSVIDGIQVFKSLSEIPEKVEAVEVIVNPSVTEEVVKECHKLGVGLVWMQPGAESDSAIEFCHTHGIVCIHDMCVLSYPG
ncbi:MAG: CoA-binding protein [Acidobacteria bacterium]|nr:CoA-binding protein [Acidobacteriota bacterium]